MKAVPARQKPESASLRHALHGLALPTSVLRALQKRGIYCTPGISLEHQHLAKRYVLRGVESGGAVSDMGRACAFVSPDGDPLPWLQLLDSIAVNGRQPISFNNADLVELNYGGPAVRKRRFGQRLASPSTRARRFRE